MPDRKSPNATMASLGGRARAAKMSPAERRASAQRAADARWGKIDVQAVIATHNGTIRIGDLEIPCGVLEDGTRVLWERGILKALGIGRSGYAHNRAKRDADGHGAGLPLFVAPINLKPFIDLELASVLQQPVWYRPRNEDGGIGILHKGVRADLLPKICNVWLKARDAGVIRGTRQAVAVLNADILLRGLAEVGITALVDEATGYQEHRERDELARILQEFVAKEIREWVPTFDVDFYREIFRLKGWQFNGNKRPKILGKITNDLVYERLAPGLLAELQRLNPKTEKGHRKTRHHQWLTEHRGHPGLIKHLSRLTGWMEFHGDGTWDEFYKFLNDKRPKYRGPTLFDELDPKDD